MFDFLKRIFIAKSDNSTDKVIEIAKAEFIPKTKPETEKVEEKEKKVEEKTTNHFYDIEQDFEDYDYLSPSEARKEMKDRKEGGEWLDFEEYGGYMNAIYAGKDDTYIEKIESMTPQQIEKWFSKRIENGQWNTTAIFEAVAEKLKPYHEEYLLKEMDTVTKGRIEGWVNARKKEGYFFSDLAYSIADKIYSGEIENRKTKSRKKKVKKQIENSTDAL